MRAYLGDLPLSLELACNGVEALAKRQPRDYEIVLMDVQMPVMDGYTATREIRTWETAQDKCRVPIVALTAHAPGGSSAESRAAGCDGLLTKPVERKDLVETIAKFAPSQAAHGPAGAVAIRLRTRCFCQTAGLRCGKCAMRWAPGNSRCFKKSPTTGAL